MPKFQTQTRGNGPSARLLDYRSGNRMTPKLTLIGTASDVTWTRFRFMVRSVGPKLKDEVWIIA